MEFLEKLYESNLFAPILFGVIAVLAVLFIIVLILAMRDAKKNRISKETPKTDDAFSQISTESTEVKFEANKEEDSKVKENESENVISSVTPVSGKFEDVNVGAPTEFDVPVIANQVEESVPVDENVNNEVSFESVDTPIETEKSAVASVEEVKKAENDLDAIAATLLAEYQKEPSNANEDKAVDLPKNNEEDNKVMPNDQFSSVFVTPNTLNEEEKNEEKSSIPSINDIPSPQPVRVVSQSTIIDSSKSDGVDINNIETETYNLNTRK